MRNFYCGLSILMQMVLLICSLTLFFSSTGFAEPEAAISESPDAEPDVLPVPSPDSTETAPATVSPSHKISPASKPPAPDTGQRFISIDFNEVDIDVFIKFISELTGRNFIVDNRVKGKISVISPTKISIDEAYKVFESVLEVNGFATVDAGEMTKIIPSPYARTMNIETRLQKTNDSPEDKIVTQLIRLKFADTNEVKQLCAPLVSKSSVVLSYAPTNLLIITDVYSNIKRLIQIIDAIDVMGIGKEISILPIEYANAEDMVKTLDSVFNAEVQARKQGQKDIILVPDSRTNMIIMLASETDSDRVKKLIQKLDKEIPKGKGKIHVYYLENAKAEDLAKVLQEIPSKESSGGGEAGKEKKVAPLLSQDIKITADKATNSLIIIAEQKDYDVISAIIGQLDKRRSMVYIECLIMEMDKAKSLNLGTEWHIGGDASYGDTKGIWGGGFSGGAMGGDPGYFATLSQSMAGVSTSSSGSSSSSSTGSVSGVLPPGFSIGVLGEAITIGNVTFPTIAAVINAYKKDNDVHILATPQILTTDNEKAKITVGKNIPYLTKASTGDTNYANYEYKDVGISLEVTPQINKDRQIRLEIKQDVTKLESTTDLFQPTTLKRTIESIVVINDKNTIVIGGLIDEAISKTDYRVPCLGSIPVIQWLFRSLGTANEQTNLYVFLTPRVIENPDEARAISEEKKIDIQKTEEENIKLYEFFEKGLKFQPKTETIVPEEIKQ
jgi:general secretion pathway protein D